MLRLLNTKYFSLLLLAALCVSMACSDDDEHEAQPEEEQPEYQDDQYAMDLISYSLASTTYGLEALFDDLSSIAEEAAEGDCGASPEYVYNEHDYSGGFQYEYDARYTYVINCNDTQALTSLDYTYKASGAYATWRFYGEDEIQLDVTFQDNVDDSSSAYNVSGSYNRSGLGDFISGVESNGTTAYTLKEVRYSITDETIVNGSAEAIVSGVLDGESYSYTAYITFDHGDALVEINGSRYKLDLETGEFAQVG